MKMSKVLTIFTIASALALAESPPAPQGAPQQPASRGVQVFSDDVFDLTPKTAPAKTKGADGRYYDGEPEYNTAQRAQWLETCAPQKDVDSQAYRDCYDAEKRKSLDGVRRQKDDIERRQSNPLRRGSSVPLLDENN